MAKTTNTENTTASNSAVVNKIGCARVMRRAWDAFRTMNTCSTFSKALSYAWASFRKELNRRPTIAEILARIEKVNAEIDKMEAAERNVRSPLNPHKPARFPNWGVSGNAETITTMAGR